LVRDRFSSTSIEQAKEVVDLCHGAYCGARITVRSLLLNGYDRTKSIDLLYIGALHPTTEKASGIRAEGLDISALTLCIDRIEG